MAARSALLRVERSSFRQVKGGQISTSAERTELVGNMIGNGDGDAPAEAVQALDGALLLEDNVITMGPNAPKQDAAVTLYDGATGTLRRNRLVNQTGHSIALLLDWSWSDPVLDGNEIGPGDRLVTTAGLWRHRASVEYHTKKDEAKALARQLKQFVKQYVLDR